jgi:hypothetical protein
MSDNVNSIFLQFFNLKTIGIKNVYLLLILIKLKSVQQFNAIITDTTILLPNGEDLDSNVRE